MDDKLTAYNDVGQAIRNKMPFVLLKPTIDDLIEGTNVRMYNQRGACSQWVCKIEVQTPSERLFKNTYSLVLLYELISGEGTGFFIRFDVVIFQFDCLKT